MHNQPARDLHKQAMEWQVTLWSGEVTEQEQRDFDTWLNTSPLHQQAWQKLQQASKPLSEVPDIIASKVTGWATSQTRF